MKYDYHTLNELALAAGFTRSHPLNVESLIFRQDVRDMCASDKCKNYNNSWSCPPAIESLERITAKASTYNSGILLQTTAEMTDEFDMGAIAQILSSHQKSWSTYVRQFLQINPDSLPMASGTCQICRKCTYPDKPCRYPSKVFPSMEAYGLWVSDVCEKSGLKYYYGPKTMTFTACILYNQFPILLN